MSESFAIAPVPMRIAGKEYTAFPLRDIDHEEMTNWCRREYLDRVKAVTTDKQDRQLALDSIVEMHWLFTPLARKMAFSARGINKLASLLARKPIPYSDTATPEGITEISDVFAMLHGRKSTDSDQSDQNSNGASSNEGNSGN